MSAVGATVRIKSWAATGPLVSGRLILAMREFRAVCVCVCVIVKISFAKKVVVDSG